MKEHKRRNLNLLPPLTPESAAPQQEPDCDNCRLLHVEITHLRDRIFAQSHALVELNKAIVFALKTLNQPLTPKPMRGPARRGKF
jgi:hypothetical protein